jgi:hypothetical protein
MLGSVRPSVSAARSMVSSCLAIQSSKSSGIIVGSRRAIVPAIPIYDYGPPVERAFRIWDQSIVGAPERATRRLVAPVLWKRSPVATAVNIANSPGGWWHPVAVSAEKMQAPWTVR